MTAIQLSDAEALAKFDNYENALDSDDAVFNALFGDDPDKGDDAPPKKKEEPSDDEAEEGDDQETRDDDADKTDEDAEEPSDEEEEGEDDEGNEDEEGETEDDEAPSKKYADDDDTYVKVKVGEEEHEVKVTDLKRLWGQEAALTRKSQEVAELRKNVDAQQAKNIAAYDIMLKKATERADSYRNLPWTQLMKDPNVPADQLQALQTEASKALEEEAFLKNEIDGFMKVVGEKQLQERKVAAAECLKALNDTKSPHYIKGWNEAMYNDIRSFAVDQGLNKEMVNALTDPGAFKILHMAMQFNRGKAKVITKKVNKTPTKIVKTSAASPAARVGQGKKVTANKAVAKAIKTGNKADAIEAFLALEGDD